MKPLLRSCPLPEHDPGIHFLDAGTPEGVDSRVEPGYGAVPHHLFG
jgi:hypothetical protein